MVNTDVVAIIPARGGSKRIPRKNIIDFMGKPMIAWTIEAALQSGCFTKVIVSTDNEEIAVISRQYGAEVPFLRDANADNHSPVSLATIRTITQLQESGLNVPQTVVQLMANCPLRSAADIQKAVDHFFQKQLDFQISCFKYGWMNPWWAHRITDENNTAVPLFSDEERLKRSQDLPDLYCPTGAIWIADTKKMIEAGSFYGKNYSFFPMSWIAAIDIDDYEDLAMAKFFQAWCT